MTVDETPSELCFIVFYSNYILLGLLEELHELLFLVSSDKCLFVFVELLCMYDFRPRKTSSQTSHHLRKQNTSKYTYQHHMWMFDMHECDVKAAQP